MTSPEPDIEFASTVEARELRFREAPRTEVTFSGEPGRTSAERSRRVNLPEPVEPGVDYRDVRVEYRFEVSAEPDEPDAARAPRT
ncbi:hypothetical protein [Glycomyces arizonensis]|uniref:hypothetical protein n=1 Tax=Glycomyces arizonensis TaxID=256035 RepID=UPI000417CED9|nr:hypothetical protein [Glycomyces arizonensis]